MYEVMSEEAMICDVKVKGRRMKALIDTGASISMLSSVVFK